MRGRALGVLLLLSACGHATPNVAPSGPSGSLQFRVLLSLTNAHPCVDPPQFGLAQDEARWIDLIDMETSCDGKLTDIPLPAVDFDTEVAVGAWWVGGVCATRRLKVDSVRREPAQVEVRASSVGAPCAGSAVAETFLAVQQSDAYDGTQEIAFFLDGAAVGVAKPGLY